MKGINLPHKVVMTNPLLLPLSFLLPFRLPPSSLVFPSPLPVYESVMLFATIILLAVIARKKYFILGPKVLLSHHHHISFWAKVLLTVTTTFKVVMIGHNRHNTKFTQMNYEILAFDVECEFVIGESGDDATVNLISPRSSEVVVQFRIAGNFHLVFA